MMSLSIFGKKDELKKQDLIRRTQTLHHYVHKYFHITNRLLEILNTHLNESPSPAVSANEHIAFSGVSLKEKAAVITNLHQDTLGLLGNVFGPLVIVQLAHSDLGSVMPPEEQRESQPVLLLALGDLVQSSARITELLSKPGNQQKSLDEALELVEDALSVLKPLCDSYNDILSEVEAYVTILSENM